MPKITYPASSPYSDTGQTNWYLGPIRLRVIPPSANDQAIPIPAKYDTRPDLMSYDLYGTPAYWWVFMVRNMDLIRDPIWDFKAGMTINVPSAERIRTLLG